MKKRNEQKQVKQRIVIGLTVILVVGLAIYAYFTYDKLYPSTNDSYVSANLVNAAPHVSGYIETINIKNNQSIRKGDVLFTIKQADYEQAVIVAQKNYLSQIALVDTAYSQMLVQQKQIAKDKVQYQFLLTEYKRYKILYQAKTIAQQAYQNITTQLNSLKIQLAADTKKYQQYSKMYQFAKAKRDAAKAQLDNAKLNLSYTKYTSPVDGYITNLNTLSVGEFVSAGQQLFGIVDVDCWWVDANFKETQLARIKKGQQATVRLDMYDYEFKGIVDSISYASGNTFSLLPAQNATGNWVKVTQRFTVRIKVNNDLSHPLRVGASSIVKINTR